MPVDDNIAASLQVALKHLESQIVTLNTTLKEFTRDQTRALEKIIRMESQIISLRERYEDKSTAMERLFARIEAHQSRLEAIDIKIEQLQPFRTGASKVALGVLAAIVTAFLGLLITGKA